MNVSWGSYKEYEGPVVWGVQPVAKPSPEASALEKEYYLATKAEGGKVDATQAYDRGVITTGAIQVIEAGSFGVTELLGFCKNKVQYLNEDDNDPLFQALAEHIKGWILVRTSSGKYRWQQKGTTNIADTIDESRQVYLAGASGLKGTWTKDQTDYAKETVRLIANLWQDPLWREAQKEYLSPRLWSFAMQSSKVILFDKTYESRPFYAATKALFISFSINSPAKTDQIFNQIVSHTAKNELFEEAFFNQFSISLLTQGFTIWKARFNAIRNDIYELYGVQISEGIASKPETGYDIKSYTIKDYQALLIKLGFSCGPSGVDGVFGKNTAAAVLQFQKKYGLQQTGLLDVPTVAQLKELNV